MIEIDKGSLFAGRYIVTNTKATDQSVKMKIIMPESMRGLFYAIMIGPDAYAGGSTAVSLWLYDKDDNQITKLAGNNIDDQRLSLVQAVRDSSGSTISSVGAPVMPYPLGWPDYLQIGTGTIAQNETLTVALRAIVYDVLPIVTAPISDTTITTSYTEII